MMAKPVLSMATTVLSIWHRIKHDDYQVTEIALRRAEPEVWIDDAIKTGGFYRNEDGSRSFVPWHSVSYIEIDRKE